MATTDQNFTVYAAAQQVVTAYLQARNNSLVEAGNPLVDAIINLNAILNGLPEYSDPNSLVVTKFDGTIKVGIRRAGGATLPNSPLGSIYGTAARAYITTPQNSGLFQSGLVTTMSGGASVKGVVDNTITKTTLYIDGSGVLQSVTLAV